MLRATPFNLFDATAAGATLSGTLWSAAGPGVFLCGLPVALSGSVAPLTNSVALGALTVGGVIAPDPRTPGLLLDFACVGNNDTNLVVEIGKLHALGAVAQPLASVTLASSTQTVANVDPFTGQAFAATTFTLFDQITISAKDVLDQVIANNGGAADDTPGQLLLTCDEAVWYYVLITTLPGTMTRVRCTATPSERRLVTKAAP